MLDEVAAFLQSNGIGDIGVSVFLGTTPAAPASLIGLYLQGGSETQNKTMDRVLFQILVRDDSYPIGYARTQIIWGLLRNSWNVLSTAKGRIVANNQPGISFRDENERIVFSLNFTGLFPKQ